MRIGIMLRALDEKGGVGVYAYNITRELLAFDRQNAYVLYYRSPEHVGRFGTHPNMAERVLEGGGKAAWDQIRIPLACRKDRIDVVFHPKFTVPLFTSCKTAMVLHGAGWFIPEHKKFWKLLDRWYINMVMPIYCRKADAIISVSQLTTDVFNGRFSLPKEKIRTVYFAPGRQFRKITHPADLNVVRQRYRLPARFIFTLSKYPGGDRKNIDGILKAYESIHGKTVHSLVVGGKNCVSFRQDYAIPDDGFGKDIYFPGYIDQEDLPAVYSLADVFLFPSQVEGFGIPVTEALKCGTPTIISRDPALREIAGNAALEVDANDPGSIATAITDVLINPDKQESLSSKALARSNHFSWDRCVRETLEILEYLDR